MLPIPAEFSARPKPSSNACDNHDDNVGLVKLFATYEDDLSSEENYGNTELVTIKGVSYTLAIPPDKETLFAHRVWSGSKLMASFLAANAEQYLRGKTTIEFGSGTGLPSLVALTNGSKFSSLTDYPDKDILETLRETVGLNWYACGQPLGRVAVVGHEWGSSVNDVIATVCELTGHVTTKFDVAILSECLWMHRAHEALVRSLDQLLSSNGRAIVTFAHHIKGLEEADLAFFQLCESVGRLTTVWQEAHEMEYMWDSSKKIIVHLRVLCRQSSMDQVEYS